MGTAPAELRDLLVNAALRAGFPLADTVDLAPALPLLQEHVTHYDRWLAQGKAGAMSYLERGRDRRADPRLVFPETRALLCVARPYPRGPAGATDATEGPRYARYLQGPDYHLEIADELERVMASVSTEWQRAGNPALRWKVCVDTSAVLERAWAALAGLGWIGKNTLLIHPQHGSYLFLAEVLLDTETGRAPSPLPDLCGHCTRCLDGCPTGAIKAPRDLDSRNCISYWTLEKRGELPLEPAQKSAISNWIAGCDVCQEVCPFNLKPVRRELELAASGSPPLALNATTLREWSTLLLESEPDYRERVARSALKRVKPAQFSRNLAIALTNALGIPTAKENNATSQTVTELIPLIEKRLRNETDWVAQEAWQHCLDQANRLCPV